MSNHSQWSAVGTGFVPVGTTQKTIKAGVYRIDMVDPDRAGLVPHEWAKDELLALPDSATGRVLKEMEKFWTLGPSFTALGYVHKRGILLHGQAGTGKTTTICLVSAALTENDGITLLIQNGQLRGGIAFLQAIRAVEPNRKILAVLEDVDEMSEDTELLALLDGQQSIGGVVFLATTNHLNLMPDRLVKRPSRFDKVIEIGPPTPAAREVYLRSRGVETDLEALVKASKGFSFAQLKELVIGVKCFGEGIDEVAKRLRSWTADTQAEVAGDDEDLASMFRREKAGATAARAYRG